MQRQGAMKHHCMGERMGERIVSRKGVGSLVSAGLRPGAG